MAVPGATPRPEGLVRHSAECVFTTRRLPSRGRSRTSDPSGKGIERRFEAAEDPFADRLAAGLLGIAAQGRAAGVAGGSRARPAPGPTFRGRAMSDGLLWWRAEVSFGGPGASPGQRFS